MGETRFPPFWSAEQAREASVLEHPPSGLTLRAVVDRVALVLDPGDCRPAHVARLAELSVDAIGPLVAPPAQPQLEPTLELHLHRGREPLDLLVVELGGHGERRQAGVVEDLVGPRPADPGDRALVAQQRVQAPRLLP